MGQSTNQPSLRPSRAFSSGTGSVQNVICINDQLRVLSLSLPTGWVWGRASPRAGSDDVPPHGRDLVRCLLTGRVYRARSTQPGSGELSGHGPSLKGCPSRAGSYAQHSVARQADGGAHKGPPFATWCPPRSNGTEKKQTRTWRDDSANT